MIVKKRSFSSESLLAIEESRIRNDRQSIFILVRELVQAQFELADQELTKRLWQDIADRGIDIDRIINLMYRCSSHDDEIEMTRVDENYQKTALIKSK